jgi:hypothetical protein
MLIPFAFLSLWGVGNLGAWFLISVGIVTASACTIMYLRGLNQRLADARLNADADRAFGHDRLLD